MSEASFTTELINQGMTAERECQKLQALLDDKIPHSTFKWDKEKNEILLFKTKRNRHVLHDDNSEDDDDDDEVEIKPKHNVLFKKEDDDNDSDNTNNNNNNNNVNDNVDDNDNDEEDEDLIRHLLHFSQQLQNVLITWGDEPQSPWSQHEEAAEQNTLVVPLATEPVPNLYTPQGVGLFLLFCHLHYLF
jgi:hypothetical protein